MKKVRLWPKSRKRKIAEKVAKVRQDARDKKNRRESNGHEEKHA